ncbi:MAG: hypothetical protein KAS32_13560 [Candidatus Peribacteraceae bacterium]|nr:hypothetical protein [Candidatus Peribacteraceae bacterium]
MTEILKIKQGLLLEEVDALEEDIRGLSLKEEEYQKLFFRIRNIQGNLKHLNNEND